MRLIDSDALKTEIEGWCVVTDDLFGMGKFHERELIRQTIDEAPTIDAAPVVQCGEWIRVDGTDADWQCSVCKDEIGLIDNAATPQEAQIHYCPNCGAKMDEKESNNA